MKSRKEVVKWIHDGCMPVTVKPTAPAPGLAPTPTVVALPGVNALLNFIYGETPEPGERLLALDAPGYKQSREELDRLIKLVKEHPAYMGEFDSVVPPALSPLFIESIRGRAEKYREDGQCGPVGFVLLDGDLNIYGWKLSLGYNPPTMEAGEKYAVDEHGVVFIAVGRSGSSVTWRGAHL